MTSSSFPCSVFLVCPVSPPSSLFVRLSLVVGVAPLNRCTWSPLSPAAHLLISSSISTPSRSEAGCRLSCYTCTSVSLHYIFIFYGPTFFVVSSVSWTFYCITIRIKYCICFVTFCICSLISSLQWKGKQFLLVLYIWICNMVLLSQNIYKDYLNWYSCLIRYPWHRRPMH